MRVCAIMNHTTNGNTVNKRALQVPHALCLRVSACVHACSVRADVSVYGFINSHLRYLCACACVQMRIYVAYFGGLLLTSIFEHPKCEMIGIRISISFSLLLK